MRTTQHVPILKNNNAAEQALSVSQPPIGLFLPILKELFPNLQSVLYFCRQMSNSELTIVAKNRLNLTRFGSVERPKLSISSQKFHIPSHIYGSEEVAYTVLQLLRYGSVISPIRSRNSVED
ncbi:hypothetical protein L1887_25398 [Cichorium endivia]|nr:hypothetical protein L1887_25398 [Cichorium endivia]